MNELESQCIDRYLAYCTRTNKAPTLQGLNRYLMEAMDSLASIIDNKEKNNLAKEYCLGRMKK